MVCLTVAGGSRLILIIFIGATCNSAQHQEQHERRRLISAPWGRGLQRVLVEDSEQLGRRAAQWCRWAQLVYKWRRRERGGL